MLQIATLGPNDDWVRGELGSPMLGSKWSPGTPIRLVSEFINSYTG